MKVFLACYGVTLAVFTAVLLWGMTGNITGGEMDYSLLCFFVLMPLVSFIGAIVLSAKKAFLYPLYPIIFGIYAYLIPFFVFGNIWGYTFFVSFVPALLGLGIGVLIRKFGKKHN